MEEPAAQTLEQIVDAVDDTARLVASDHASRSFRRPMTMRGSSRRAGCHRVAVGLGIIS
jgi:hypothetical protein